MPGYKGIALSWTLCSISSLHVDVTRLGLKDDTAAVSGPFYYTYTCLSPFTVTMAALGWWLALSTHGV